MSETGTPSPFSGMSFGTGRAVARDGVQPVFKAVSRISTARVDGVEVGGTANAYREFEVDVTDAARAEGQHQFQVVADNNDQPLRRWYVDSDSLPGASPGAPLPEFQVIM